jgi:hypothetical protein
MFYLIRIKARIHPKELRQLGFEKDNRAAQLKK